MNRWDFCSGFIRPGSHAEKAGVRVGDEVLQVGHGLPWSEIV